LSKRRKKLSKPQEAKHGSVTRPRGIRELVRLFGRSTRRGGSHIAFYATSSSQIRGLIREYVSQAIDELNGVIERGSDGLERATERGQEFAEQGKESLPAMRKAEYAGAKN